MYAYVKFVDDNIKCIVQTNQIKHFDVGNINYSKKYKVKYEDGEYYKACILLIGSTEEEITKAIQESRIKCPPLSMLISSCDEESKTSKANKNNYKSKKSTAQSSTIIKKNYEALLNSIQTTSTSTTEKVDCDYQSRCASLERENLLLKEEVHKLRNLNYKLQENILNDWKELSAELLNRVATSHHTDDEHKESTRSVGSRIDNQIHLGRNVYLNETIYDSICFKSKNNSVFIKNLASALFGDCTLQNSSVTGVTCNRLKTDPRPPLDPTKTMAIKDILQFKLLRENWTPEAIEAECKHINHTLAQKIADVRRTSRANNKTKNVNTNDNIDVNTLDTINVQEIDDAANLLSTELTLSLNLLQEELHN